MDIDNSTKKDLNNLIDDIEDLGTKMKLGTNGSTTTPTGRSDTSRGEDARHFQAEVEKKRPKETGQVVGHQNEDASALVTQDIPVTESLLWTGHTLTFTGRASEEQPTIAGERPDGRPVQNFRNCRQPSVPTGYQERISRMKTVAELQKLHGPRENIFKHHQKRRILNRVPPAGLYEHIIETRRRYQGRVRPTNLREAVNVARAAIASMVEATSSQPNNEANAPQQAEEKCLGARARPQDSLGDTSWAMSTQVSVLTPQPEEGILEIVSTNGDRVLHRLELRQGIPPVACKTTGQRCQEGPSELGSSASDTEAAGPPLTELVGVASTAREGNPGQVSAGITAHTPLREAPKWEQEPLEEPAEAEPYRSTNAGQGSMDTLVGPDQAT